MPSVGWFVRKGYKKSGLLIRGFNVERRRG